MANDRPRTLSTSPGFLNARLGQQRPPRRRDRRRRPIARATVEALALLAIGSPVFSAFAQVDAGAPDAAQAGRPSEDRLHRFDIPAGSLDQALGRFGREAGIAIAVSSEVTAGLAGPGVSGDLTVAAALRRLLDGTGLTAVRDAQGEYTLRRIGAGAASGAAGGAANGAASGAAAVPAAAVPAAPRGSQTLPAVSVIAQRVADGTSEGTGSYAPTISDSATRLGLKPRETPQTVTVFTSQMIEDKGVTSVEQVLQQTPGVVMIGDASQNSQIFVRGFSLDSGIFIDGLNTTSAQPVYEGSLSQGLDPAIADRIEVVKGATGIVAGLGSPSASVNFIRKRPTTDFQAHAELGAGNWRRWSALADVGGPLNEQGNLRGRLVAAQRSGDSYIDRYSSDRTVLYGIVDVDLTASTLASLAIDHQRNRTDGAFNWDSNPAFYTDGGVFSRGPSFSTGQSWSYWNTRQTSITPMLEHRFDNGWKAKLALRKAQGKIDRVAFFPGSYVDRATGEISGGWNAGRADRHLRDSDTDSADAYATGRFGWLGREHDLAVGVSYGQNRFAMAGYPSDPTPPYTIDTGSIAAPPISATPDSDMRYTQRQAGLFATARFNPTDAIKVMVGGRVSNWQFDTQDRLEATDTRVKHNSIFTPYLGLLFDVHRDVTLYASYTGTFRPGLNFGADGKLLDPAEGYNREVGVKMGLLDDKLNLALAAYQALEDNFPEFANEGRLPNGNWIYRSIDGVKTTGYEAEVSGQLSPRWEVMGGYTYNRARDAEGKPKLTYVPKHLLRFSASHHWNDQLTLGGTVRWQSGSYYDTSINVATPPLDVTQRQKAYTLLDLMARWQFNRRLSLSLNLNNLLDKSYYRSMWGYADYGEPRSLFVTMRVNW